MNLQSLQSWIRSRYLNQKSLPFYKQSFLSAHPFPYVVFPHFFQEQKVLAILSALKKESFYFKPADLFQFHQTNDLVGSKQKVLLEFRALLSSPGFVTFLSALTHTKLKPGLIDMSGALYQDTEFLLCHDDRLEGRKIAYFLYLSDLKKSDGGALQLFASKNGKPTAITTKIIPKFNTFAFFEVSPKSFHAVEEVITRTPRITLSGWFHGN